MCLINKKKKKEARVFFYFLLAIEKKKIMQRGSRYIAGKNKKKEKKNQRGSNYRNGAVNEACRIKVGGVKYTTRAAVVQEGKAFFDKTSAFTP